MPDKEMKPFDPASGSDAPANKQFTPMEARGTLVYLARSGGFDVRECPDAKALAAFIAHACNSFAHHVSSSEAAPINIRSLQEQSEAWLAVVETLHNVSPSWLNGDGTGTEMAVAAIRALAAADSKSPDLPAKAGEQKPVALTVWEGAMPESNGKSNFTAVLHRKDAKGFDVFSDGFTIARSEHPDRVRYEGDCVRYLIGEIAERPDILAYDADKHSGYVSPKAVQPADGKLRQALVSARLLLANLEGISRNNMLNLAMEEVESIDAALAGA